MRRRLGGGADVDDVVQEALLGAYRHLADLKDDARLGPLPAGAIRLSAWQSKVAFRDPRIQLLA